MSAPVFAATFVLPASVLISRATKDISFYFLLGFFFLFVAERRSYGDEQRKVGQFLSFKYTKPDWNIYPSTLAADSLKGAVSEMDLLLLFPRTKTAGRVRSAGSVLSLLSLAAKFTTAK